MRFPEGLARRFCGKVGRGDNLAQPAAAAVGHGLSLPFIDLGGEAIAEGLKVPDAFLGGVEIALRELDVRRGVRRAGYSESRCSANPSLAFLDEPQLFERGLASE